MSLPCLLPGDKLTGMRIVSSVAVLLVLSVAGTMADEQKPGLRERAFRFSYAATVTGLKPGTMARVWVPVPSRHRHRL